jgi:Neuraminidase (sialidase)
VASSHDNAETFTTSKVNDDNGQSSHVFPTVQVNKNGWVYASWLDRRNDANNELTDAWAAVSRDGGATWSPNREQTDVATSWRVRADARPNMGDYNSSELLNDNQFVMIWNDGRFPPPAPTPQAATPDTIFTIANGLGNTTGPTSP